MFFFARWLCAAGPFAYIPNNGSSSVSVIDLTSNTVTATITGITGGPWAAAVNASGTRVYVTRVGANAVSVIDTSNNTVIGNITGFSKPYSVVVNPAGTFAYVTNSDVNVNTVSIVNTATNTISGTISVGPEPYGIAITPDGSKLYVANSNASLLNATSSVTVITTASNTVLGTFDFGGAGPRGVAINRSGTRAYVSNYYGNSVAVIDVASNSILTNITLNIGISPEGIAVSPNDTPIYAVNFKSPGSVAVINAASNSVTTTISGVGAFPMGVAFHPNGASAYVVNNSSNSVSLVNVASNTVSGTLGVQTAPVGIGGLTVLPPRASSLSDGDATPTVRPINGGAFTLTVNGTMFIAGTAAARSTVLWNGSPRTTTFVNAQQITAAITAADVSVAGNATVTVNNPAPAGGLSNGLIFTICTGPPSPGNALRLTKLSPSVHLAWTPVAGATGYNVKGCTGGPACVPALLATGAAITYNDPVLANAASYIYAIEAYNTCAATP